MQVQLRVWLLENKARLVEKGGGGRRYINATIPEVTTLATSISDLQNKTRTYIYWLCDIALGSFHSPRFVRVAEVSWRE
jgi:hypothetical protein